MALPETLRGGSRVKHQEPDTLKVVRPVLRGGKLVRVYLSRQELKTASNLVPSN